MIKGELRIKAYRVGSNRFYINIAISNKYYLSLTYLIQLVYKDIYLSRRAYCPFLKEGVLETDINIPYDYRRAVESYEIGSYIYIYYQG